MLVPLRFALPTHETRTSHHIARDCQALRRELAALYRETEIPHEDYEELFNRLNRLQQQATSFQNANPVKRTSPLT